HSFVQCPSVLQCWQTLHCDPFHVITTVTPCTCAADGITNLKPSGMVTSAFHLRVYSSSPWLIACLALMNTGDTFSTQTKGDRSFVSSCLVSSSGGDGLTLAIFRTRRDP